MAAMHGLLGDLSDKAFTLDPKLMRGFEGHKLVTGSPSFSIYHLAGRWPDRVAAVALMGAFQLALRWEGWRWRILDKAAASIADKQGGLLPGDRWHIGMWRDGRVLGMHGVWRGHSFEILAGPPTKVPEFPALPCGESMLIARARWDESGDVVARAWDACDAASGEDGKPLIARWSPKTGAQVKVVTMEEFNADVPEADSFVFDAGGGRRYASRPNRLWESRDGGPFEEVVLPEIPNDDEAHAQYVWRIDTGRVVDGEVWLGGSLVHPDAFWEMDFQASNFDRYVVLHTAADVALPSAKVIADLHHKLTLRRCPRGRTLLADEITCARDRVVRFVACMNERAAADDDIVMLQDHLRYKVRDDHTVASLEKELRASASLGEAAKNVVEACAKSTR